jgi:hypothetical protein
MTEAEGWKAGRLEGWRAGKVGGGGSGGKGGLYLDRAKKVGTKSSRQRHRHN